MVMHNLLGLSPAGISTALNQGHALLKPLCDDLRAALLLALIQEVVTDDVVVGPLALHELLNATTRAALGDLVPRSAAPGLTH